MITLYVTYTKANTIEYIVHWVLGRETTQNDVE